MLLPLPLVGPYDYRIPASFTLVPGDFVKVPLGKKNLTGVVWDKFKPEEKLLENEIDDARLREIIARLEDAHMAEPMRRLIDWVAAYSMSTQGAVLRMAMSGREAPIYAKPQIYYRLSSSQKKIRITPTRKRVIAILRTGPSRQATDLAREANVSIGVVRGMAKLGALDTLQVSSDRALLPPNPELPGPELSKEQAEVAENLVRKTIQPTFSVTLLDGVTGAGKTEVYFEAISSALKIQRQILVLLPEIALTAQFLTRFQERFGTTAEEWHSDITPSRRRQTWRAVADGRARVVVGARSALFLPFKELGLIVVDEEHDLSYKQEEGVVYHARDMAVVRAKLEAIPVILVSATPSIETSNNVSAGRYDTLRLPSRHGGADLPKVNVVDLRQDTPQRQRWISPTLKKALFETFKAKEQSLLFLNRRGYSPLTLCRVCGHRFECPHCTSWLVEHRFQGKLNCHHCGYSMHMPTTCPVCNVEGQMAACGPGVERLAEEVTSTLPDARISLMTSDTIRSANAAAEIISRVQNNEIDILIGTQLVAKGHHFPKLTLVGIIDADLGLNGGDLRASERTFQLLHQVAGRAGRASLPGQVLMQTHHPEHPVMAALVAGDRDAFLAAETEQRKTGNWPPFGRLAALIISSPNENDANRIAELLAKSAPQTHNFQVLGPAPAPLAVLRGRHRRRLLVRCTRTVQIQTHIRKWLKKVKLPNAVRLQVDIDPYSFI